MKEKLIYIIELTLSIIVIISSVTHIITQKMIPGLSPFSLAIVMGIKMRTYYIRNKRSEVKNYRLIFGLLLGAGILSFIAGIVQIIDYGIGV